MIDGTLATATRTPLMSAEECADADRERDRDDGRQTVVAGQQLGGEERRHANGRADGQIDVAGDDHERLAGGDDRGDRDGDEQAADEPRAEVVVDDHAEQHDREHQDAEEREPLEPLGLQPRSADRPFAGEHDDLLLRDHVTPTAAVMMRSCSRSVPAKIPIWRPSRMTSTRSLIARTSGRSDEIRITATPARGHLADELVDVRLRADVDPAGGLVEDDHRRLRVEPLGEHHLLLVATGEVADGRQQRRARDPQPLAVDVGRSALGRAVDEPPAGDELAQAREGDVGGHRLRERQPEPAAVLGDVGDAP